MKSMLRYMAFFILFFNRLIDTAVPCTFLFFRSLVILSLYQKNARVNFLSYGIHHSHSPIVQRQKKHEHASLSIFILLRVLPSIHY